MIRTLYAITLVLALSSSAFSQTTSDSSRMHSITAVAQQTRPDMTFHVAVEQLPEPIGGIKAIQQKVVYPEIAKRAGIEGTVFVEVFVDENGNVVKTAVVRGIGAGCDEAAMAAVQKLKFQPGRHRGIPVKVRLAIPIRFRLSRTAASKDGSKVSIVEGPRSLENSIRYPEIAVRAGLQGEVAVRVSLDGQRMVTSLTITRGIGAGCDQAVMSALLAHNFTNDPQYSSLKGAQSFTVIVRFLLPSKEKEEKKLR